MLEIIFSPTADEVRSSLVRSTQKTSLEVKKQVASILDEVRVRGDKALYEYTAAYDGVTLTSLFCSKEEILRASSLLSDELKKAIDVAYKNIETFHASQKVNHPTVEVMPGVYCWQKSLPIEVVGLYIPGGTAPLFSTLLMLAIPAKIAGCEHIIVATPVRKDGSVDPAILYAAQLVGVDTILTVGGAQAIAAFAYGTESVIKVDKIFGPGNTYVTEAKKQVTQEGIAIDMPAGPSEVMVVIDESTNISSAAADVLSQCEHGYDSQAVLVIIAQNKQEGQRIANNVKEEIEKQLSYLSRKKYIIESLEHSFIVIVYSIEEALTVINGYASEHLILNTKDFSALEEGTKHAGSVFLGSFSPESAGDYASGTNHTLPTSGLARSYSGLSLQSFLKTVSYQRITYEGLKKLGPTIIEMADYETLDAHSNAVKVRLAKEEEERR
ncbi:MAG: histidinol dehydrogenase [Spirochaetia bacterium]|nr:histidinol dehydrogenase [Spirochaetia bacterium]